MDPLTAMLVLGNTIAEIVKLGMEGQPPEVRADLSRIHLEFMKMFLADVKETREFWAKLKPGQTAPAEKLK